ncbi:unnamed protein product, partial [Amoebophrya sp. A120]
RQRLPPHRVVADREVAASRRRSDNLVLYLLPVVQCIWHQLAQHADPVTALRELAAHTGSRTCNSATVL